MTRALESVDRGHQQRLARLAELSRLITAHLGQDEIIPGINFAFRKYDPWLAYGQSKTANILFAVEANRRWAGEGITVNAVSPGAIYTRLQRHTGGRGSGAVPPN